MRRSTRFEACTCLLSFWSFLQEKEVFQILDYAHVGRENMGGIQLGVGGSSVSFSSHGIWVPRQAAGILVLRNGLFL